MSATRLRAPTLRPLSQPLVNPGDEGQVPGRACPHWSALNAHYSNRRRAGSTSLRVFSSRPRDLRETPPAIPRMAEVGKRRGCVFTAKLVQCTRGLRDLPCHPSRLSSSRSPWHELSVRCSTRSADAAAGAHTLPVSFMGGTLSDLWPGFAHSQTRLRARAWH